jgi:hypothetical protein
MPLEENWAMAEKWIAEAIKHLGALTRNAKTLATLRPRGRSK